MAWLSLLRVVLSLANSLAGIVREKQLMDAGEAQATAKALAEIAGRLKIGDQVGAEVAAMSDTDLDSELRS